MRSLLTLFLALGVLSSTTGCSNAPEYCERMCQCENCSDNEYDECIIAYEAFEDRASAYGCLQQFDALHVCALNNNVCVGNQFSPEAECLLDEYVDYDDCERASSSLR